MYTMKTIHTTTQPTQFPKFWNEEWLQVAIDELDKRKMTPDERFAYERTLAINAEVIRVVNAQIQEAKEETVLKMLRAGKLSIAEIAEYTGFSSKEIDRLLSGLRPTN